MRSKRCETCRYFERTGFELDYYDGTCRIRSVPCTTFPSRKYNEWCGEWACDETETPPVPAAAASTDT